MIGVDSGWEIYVAGNGGIKTEVAQFLCKVKTPPRCSSTAARSCSSTARKAGTSSARCTTSAASGSTTSRRRSLDDAANRRRSWERLQFALDGEPDPWFEFDKARVDMRQFEPIAV